MPDRELEFFDSLIKEARRAARLYLVFGSTLVLSGVVSIVWQLNHSGVDKVVEGGIASAFGAIPVAKFFAARHNVIYLAFLKARWQDARAEDKNSDLKKLKDVLNDFIKGVLSKPFYSLS